jgi:hypothetical protein
MGSDKILRGSKGMRGALRTRSMGTRSCQIQRLVNKVEGGLTETKDH